VPRGDPKKRLIKKLATDPKFLASWARQKVIRASVELAEIMESELTGGNAPSQKVGAIKELMTNIEILLEEANELSPESQEKGKPHIAPTTRGTAVGSRAPWGGARPNAVAKEDAEPLGEPPVELLDRPE